MTREEYLSILEGELTTGLSRERVDAIMQQVEDLFDVQEQQGRTEEEICEKLASPAEQAAKLLAEEASSSAPGWGQKPPAGCTDRNSAREPLQRSGAALEGRRAKLGLTLVLVMAFLGFFPVLGYLAMFLITMMGALLFLGVLLVIGAIILVIGVCFFTRGLTLGLSLLGVAGACVLFFGGVLLTCLMLLAFRGIWRMVRTLLMALLKQFRKVRENVKATAKGFPSAAHSENPLRGTDEIHEGAYTQIREEEGEDHA